MRRRAFVPESQFRLEGRIALTAIGHIHGSYGLGAVTYGQGIFLVKNAFQLYGVSGDFQRLRAQLATYSVGIPYHRATMLGPKTNAMLQEMLANIRAHAPHPIKTAMHTATTAVHADVQKLIDSRAVFVKYSA